MGLSLTNPALLYQDPTVDPTTGMPMVKPRVQFFPNNAARLQAAAQSEAQRVQPTTSSVEGSIDGTPTVGEIQPPIPPAAKFFKPSYTSTLTDPSTGLPAPINPAQSKLGKLVTILGSAARGALAGWGYGNPAQGAQAAREIPAQEEQQRLNLATSRAGLAPVQTPYGEMPAAYAVKIFPSMITAQSRQNVAQTAAQSRQSVANTQATSRENVANINKRYSSVPGVGLFDTQSRQVIPETAQGIAVTPEIAQDYDLPADFVGKRLQLSTFASLERAAAQYAPTVTSESQSTDLMGNTRTNRTSQKVAPGTSGGSAPAVAPRGTGAPTSFVQQTPGGPLVPAAAATPRRVARPAAPAATAPTAAGGASPAAPNTAIPPSELQLAPEVEQRLAASGLNAQQQAYVRGLLAYRGQMPSPRARNYAQTLGTLTSLDPNFDATNYDARRKTQVDYTPGGKVGQQALAFNTAIAHLGMLSDAADALKNHDIQVLNRIGNYLHVQLGSNEVTTFNNIADAVDGEVAKTFKGNATEGELNRVGAHFGSNLSPDQIQGNIRSTVGLLNGKMGEMESAYQRQMQRPISMVSPEAKATIQRITPQTKQPGTNPRNDGIRFTPIG